MILIVQYWLVPLEKALVQFLCFGFGSASINRTQTSSRAPGHTKQITGLNKQLTLLTHHIMAPQGSDENQFTVQGYNIVTILKRLEAATSRLEDITIFQEQANKLPQGTREAGAPGGTSQAETPGSASTGTTSASVATARSEPTPTASEKTKFVTAFEEFVQSSVRPFVESSKSIDAAVASAAEAFHEAFVEQSKVLALVAHTKKPDVTDQNLLKLLTPINRNIEAISGLKDANRRSEFFNHLNTVTEGAPVLGWIVSPTPLSFVPEFKDSASFWSNRVMKEYKDKDPKQVEWVKQFLLIFDKLKDYVKEFHAKGLSWNPQGKTLSESLAAVNNQPSASSSAPAPAPAPAAGGSAPPPPPPAAPPADLFDNATAGKEQAAPSGGMNAVFADLNKGENVTSGLKKVEKSQMTHKNPSLREQGPAKKPTPPKKPQSLSSRSNSAKSKPPRVELVDGAKWIIENLTAENTPEPVIINAEMQHSVFIGNTEGITVQINGKGNAVSLSETKNTAVVIESLVSGVDIIKSVKFGLQVTGVVPLVTVDRSDEGSIYLSQESVNKDSSVITSNTSALNINIPQDDDFAEMPVPEQLQHFIRNGKLVSEVVEHAG